MGLASGLQALLLNIKYFNVAVATELNTTGDFHDYGCRPPYLPAQQPVGDFAKKLSLCQLYRGGDMFLQLCVYINHGYTLKWFFVEGCATITCQLWQLYGKF